MPLPAHKTSLHPALAPSLAFAALATLTFWATDLDLGVARWAYSPTAPHWPGQDTQPWAALYRFGEGPAFIAGVFALAVAFLSYLKEPFAKWRGAACFLAAVFLLGNGLLVNVLAKGLAGRPRPSEITDFLGVWEFHRPFELGLPGRGRSFLSGHASMGFFWMALFFIFKGPTRWFGLTLGLAFGLTMGLARILQGGHFLSDVVLCGALMLSLMAALSPLVQAPPGAAIWRRKGVWLAALASLAGWLLIGQPTYEERRFLAAPLGTPAVNLKSTDRLAEIPWPESPTAATMLVELAQGDLKLRLEPGTLVPGKLSIDEALWGQGLPGRKVLSEAGALSPDPHAPATVLRLAFHQRLKGLWWNTRGAYSLRLPDGAALDLSLRALQGTIYISGLPPSRRIFLRGLSPSQAAPEGFNSMGNGAWTRDGALPLIALDLEAQGVTFLR